VSVSFLQMYTSFKRSHQIACRSLVFSEGIRTSLEIWEYLEASCNLLGKYLRFIGNIRWFPGQIGPNSCYKLLHSRSRAPDPGALIIRPRPQLLPICRRSCAKLSNERLCGTWDSLGMLKTVMGCRTALERTESWPIWHRFRFLKICIMFKSISMFYGFVNRWGVELVIGEYICICVYIYRYKP